jgi:hypothetical protein
MKNKTLTRSNASRVTEKESPSFSEDLPFDLGKRNEEICE